MVRALYLADSVATAWAEWYRHSAELGVPPQARLPRAVHEIAIELPDVADLSDPRVLARHGIRKLTPSRRQWPRTQPIGEGYFAAGRAGLLVPSAAHVGGRVLVVFRRAAELPDGVRASGAASLHTELPPLPTGLRT